MTRIKLLLLASFLVTFAVGLTAGLLISHVRKPSKSHSWLSDELNLTGQQREQMRSIWSKAMSPPLRQQGKTRMTLARERDEAVAAILTAEQRPLYEKVLQEHARKLSELSQERKRAFEEAVQKTKQILTPEQALKYEELQKKHAGRGGMRRTSRPSTDVSGEDENAASTLPADEQSHDRKE